MPDQGPEKNHIPEIIREKFLVANGARVEVRMMGGLSRAQVFRCSSPQGRLCLRAWPPTGAGQSGPSLARLEQIREQVSRAHQNSFTYLPRYFVDSENRAFVQAEGRFWELTEWMPGTADYLVAPSPAKMQSAMQALARLHTIWAAHPVMIPSPAVADRIHKLLEAMSPQMVGKLRARASLASGDDVAKLVERTLHVLQSHGSRVLQDLLSIHGQATVCHFVLRDIWSDHVLFSEDSLTGIIDLGAARIDEPATDLARLLGSLEPNSFDRWKFGWDAYCRRNRQVELRRVAVLDRASCLLSAVQWARWLGLENRQFAADRRQLLNRWASFLDRMERFPWDGIAMHCGSC